MNETTKPKEKPKEEKVTSEDLLPPKKEESRKVEVTREELMACAALSDRLVRIERMMEWLVVQRVTDDQKLIKQPNISDIFRDIAAKMVEEKKKEKDEVPPAA